MSLVIGPPHQENKPQPSPLFYISIHLDGRVTNKSNMPQIQLHNGPKEIYPVMGDVQFRRSTLSDITIWHTGQENLLSKFNEAISNELQVELTKKGSLTANVYSFAFDVPAEEGTIREIFEWRQSGGPEVRALAAHSVRKESYSRDDRGLKLVNARTRELVAVFVNGKHDRADNPMEIVGKLRFIKVEQNSEGLRKVVVLSILSIMERE
jgi:hypothetical protein